jgi:hypothetical protein
LRDGRPLFAAFPAMLARHGRRGAMTRKSLAIVPAAALLGLIGCAAPVPTGPSVVALPPAGKEFARFQQEDAFCRQEAFRSIGGEAAPQPGNTQALGTAALATGVGAAAGALIGSATGNAGSGAAIGAGIGLAGGSLAGAAQAQNFGGNLQRGFDVTYMQCMSSFGNTIQQPPRVVAVPVPDPWWGPRPYWGPPGFGRPFYW